MSHLLSFSNCNVANTGFTGAGSLADHRPSESHGVISTSMSDTCWDVRRLSSDVEQKAVFTERVQSAVRERRHLLFYLHTGCPSLGACASRMRDLGERYNVEVIGLDWDLGRGGALPMGAAASLGKTMAKINQWLEDRGGLPWGITANLLVDPVAKMLFTGSREEAHPLQGAPFLTNVAFISPHTSHEELEAWCERIPHANEGRSYIVTAQPYHQVVDLPEEASTFGDDLAELIRENISYIKVANPMGVVSPQDENTDQVVQETFRAIFRGENPVSELDQEHKGYYTAEEAVQPAGWLCTLL